MNQGPYNRRPSSRRRSNLARRREGNKFNSGRDSYVRDQYASRGNRFQASDSSGGGGGGGIKINSNSIAILAGVLVWCWYWKPYYKYNLRWTGKYCKSATVGYGCSRPRLL